MKKIIYSFVIMIAAGSLFTSCVTNTEPQGIKDIREAKADYLESLVNLKNAEAEKVKAQAAYEQAQADHEQALVELQKIQNQIAQCKADEEKAKLTVTLKQKEAELKAQEKALAEAEYELEKYLKSIALESKKLTENEEKAIEAYTTAYREYLHAEQELRKVEAQMYDVDLDYANYVAKLQIQNAAAALEIEKWGEVMEALDDSLDITASREEIAKFKKEWEVDSAILEVEKVNVQKEFNVFKIENVNESIKAFSKDLSAWFVWNVALPAPFHFAYKTELPDNEVVVNAFEENMSKLCLIQEKNGFQIAGGEIAANFNNAPDARKKIFGVTPRNDDPTDVRSLYAVVDALSRELVIDTNATSVDTVGLAKAVADAKTEYTKIEAALKAGADAYAAAALADLKAKKLVKAEKDSLKQVEESKYKAQRDSLKAAIENFVGVWNNIAEDSQKMGKDDTTNLFNAFKKLIDVRAEVLPYEGKREYFHYLKGYKEDKTTPIIDSVKFTALVKNNFVVGKKKYLTPLGGHSTLADALNEFFGIDFTTGRMDISSGKLVKISYDNLYTATTYFNTLFFEKYYSHADMTKILLSGKEKATEFKPETLVAAEKAATVAETAVENATKAFVAKHKEFYTDVYGKFWGIKVSKAEIDSTKEVKVSEKEKVVVWGFAKDYTPLVQNFTKETFTKEPAIVTFDIDKNSYTKKGGFANDKVGDKVPVNDNKELEIVWKQLSDNQGGKLAEQTEFRKLLFAKVLFKEAVQAEYTGWDTDDVKEAIDALKGICLEMAVAYADAAATQVKESEGFFQFLEGLIGEDVLEELFGRIDAAIAAYDQYKPAKAGYDPVMDVIEQIADGEISSREVAIAVFEDFMCGRVVGYAYTDAYVAHQVAAAFSGDQFEILFLDILDKFIDALDIDIVSKDPGNIVEKLLFGTINTGKFVKGHVAETAFNIVVPTITSYIVSDFGGIFGELTKQHFTEWAEAWDVYEQKIAEIQALQDVYHDLSTLYTAYENDLDAALEIISQKYEEAFITYEETSAKLARIEAGADPYTLWYEFVTDWVEYWEKCVETAAIKLKAAEAAYNQVIKNHE